MHAAQVCDAFQGTCVGQGRFRVRRLCLAELASMVHGGRPKGGAHRGHLA